LFVNGSDSIWIERPTERLMIVAGPGTLREEREFDDEDTLQAYQVALAERLTESGWFLWGFDKERRALADRRGAARGTQDRRQRIQPTT
jgi:hypothetical protein